jgi:hypothetical protein
VGKNTIADEITNKIIISGRVIQKPKNSFALMVKSSFCILKKAVSKLDALKNIHKMETK